MECTVCLEEFEEEGDRVPKLLPCSHTLCLGCLEQLERGSRVVCPECRAQHRAPPQGPQGFPTNRYCACVGCVVCVQSECVCVCVCVFVVRTV